MTEFDPYTAVALALAAALSVAAVGAAWVTLDNSPASTAAANGPAEAAEDPTPEPSNASETTASKPAESGSENPGGNNTTSSDDGTRSWPTVVVQPGTPIAVVPDGESACTLGFVLNSTTNASRYALTVGHCIAESNATIYASDRDDSTDDPPIGDVVAYNYTTHVDDWALIRLDRSADHVVVNASVRYWTGPTGVADPGSAYPDKTGDRVCHYGWGQWYGARNRTRSRCGVYTRTTNDEIYGRLVEEFHALGFAWYGDSGSPVIDYETGRAIGRINAGDPVAGEWKGKTLQHTLRALSLHGWSNLTLATAPYDPPSTPVPGVPPP